ncbi:Unconventional myosin-VIIb [Takifugu flavidus]|uniref:Unconventional myosin-VIIb n=1 Tax=Takifugu flavidus TaxID=433684 RepID=A0A5C6NZE7_9TELE|nr:Unconventional myosin-VIIb [Takifugu flavidus]
MLEKGEWVWVDSTAGVAIGARVKVTSSGQRLLVDDEGKEHSLSQELEASLRVMHPTLAEGVDDMIDLGEMSEAGLLRNLMLRHKRGIIYTYIGSVLVAINPYQDFPIYTSEQVRLYHGRNLGELPPHIYALAEACYSHMIRHLQNQCCIISGESGAGKTESTKLILRYLASVSSEMSEQRTERLILESNPILEAFGNAKTIRNDNSSRFGKYLEIFFNRDGVIEGARMEQYLLEKSRVCHQAPEERNYHIFYCMLAGTTAEEKETLGLGDAREYAFLTKGACVECEGRDDGEIYQDVCSALELFFSDNQRRDILKLLAAILHLGNVNFQGNTQNNLETCHVNKSGHFHVAASLLGVRKTLLASSLTSRSIMTMRESVTKPLSSKQASDCRDALVKAIYNKLFIWIVGKINSVIYSNLAESPKSSFLSVGLLDIFGFENFDRNSFEQLFINFANEKLQKFFVDHIFRQEQEEYQREEIPWTNIRFNDNWEIVDLLAVKPCNLLALIDEESQFPRGSDFSMLQKMNQHHTGNRNYVASSREGDTDFGIRHFAGVVYYESRGFLEKNRDAVSLDLIKMVDVSTNQLLREMFQSQLPKTERKISINNRVTMTPRNSVRGPADNSKQVPTLSGQFRQSLDSLMKALSDCQPFFVRCIKPNDKRQPKVFDRNLCMHQLKCFGMMDTIHIRKLGYPIRHSHKDFLNRYRMLLDRTVCDPKTNTAAACCEAICRSVIQDKNKWKIGKTKIFLKDSRDIILEQTRDRMRNRAALVIQTFMKGSKDRISFLRKRRAAVMLQNYWRSCRRRRKIHSGFERLISKIRSRKLRSQYLRQQAAAVTIQRHLRGYFVRKDLKQKSNAAVRLQAFTRGMLARRRTEKIRDDNHELIASELQQRLLAIARELEDPESFAQQDDLQVKSSESPHVKENGITPFSSPASSTSTPPPEEDEEFEDNSGEFSFHRFSVLHFQGGATHTHIIQRLTEPLLHHDDEGDALACLTVWWVILRFMEDLPEPTSPQTATKDSRPISRNLPMRQGIKLDDIVELEQLEDFREEENVLVGEGPNPDRPLSSLEKLHLIAGYALSRKDIRHDQKQLLDILNYSLDEIYCQICKQLVKNQNKRSQMKGWTLLSICLGIFPPTDLFMKYLERFLLQGPEGYGSYCSELLSRIKVNGERKEPPCWIELQAAKSKEPINVSVALLDGRSVDLHLDSASIAAEVCRALADKINLQDKYGFSLYISLFDKMWSLGSCGDHVLDAISQCEQEMRRQGKEGRDAPWTLCFRKELFAPWHDCSMDPISTDLIYRQVIKGIKSNEYTCEKEDEHISLAAMHYHIQFGPAYNRDNMQKVVEECIADELIESRGTAKWIDLISSAHLQAPKGKSEDVKVELVNSARQKWPLNFSRFYEVTMVSGPPLKTGTFTVAVNWSGILFMDGKDKKLLEMSYLEIQRVHTSGSESGPPSVGLTTVRGEFVLKGEKAADMAALIEEHLEGLRGRSVYTLAQQDISRTEDPTFLVCERGDLLLVEREDQPSADATWIRATNQRTCSSGTVYRDLLLFLPTLSRPSEDVLELLSPGQKKMPVVQNSAEGEETVAPVSLKDFALENFRPAGSRHGAHKSERLWACSGELLRQPLLKNLMHSAELSNLACNAFTDIPPLFENVIQYSGEFLDLLLPPILRYMGDYPHHARNPIELTDQIFGPATQHDALKDEIYCQIMRQMTGNSNRSSMERGWQLMWLCTGLFPPSPALRSHARRFLESRARDQLAADCLQRLQEMLRSGRDKEPRRFPPDPVELEAIQQNSTRILHKVHFPNETNEIFEVTSTTTIRELCDSVASQLKLSSVNGYGLYLKTRKKVKSLEENQYFFDSTRQASHSLKKAKKAKEASAAAHLYLVMFKRKLWLNVIPGRDPVADLMFHFPQEVPKYLKGRHNCTREDMIHLGGLLFRIQVDSDKSQFVAIPEMLKDLVPADQINLMTPEDWKKHIFSSYKDQSGITVQEAKIRFLKVASTWRTFGCSFFEAKQTCEESFPNAIVVVISKKGVGFMAPETKEELVAYPFSRITHYHARNEHFHMSIKTVMKCSKFVCETAKAEIIEDLLRSYISMYERQRLPPETTSSPEVYYDEFF